MAKRRRSSSAERRRGGKKRQASAADVELPEYLKRRGLHPRKALGQHFLVDEFLLTEIADACGAGPDDTVLEVGAGPGGLTEELVERAGTVVAVELDEELAALTRGRLLGAPGLKVLAADILEFEPVELLEEAGAGPPYIACGNLPYYITQPVVRRLLEADPAPRRIVVLVQREVAKRIVGGPGRESLLSMAVKFYGEPEYLFDVPAEAFWPPPKVQSAVIGINSREHRAVELPPGEEEAFFHLLRAGFAQPRKQLHNTLPSALEIGDAAATGALEAAGIDPAARAQHLDLDDWGRVYRELRDRHPGVFALQIDGRDDFDDIDEDKDEGPDVFA